MINAKELSKRSSAVVKAYLAKIEPLIRKAVMDGEQSVALYIDGLWDMEQYQPELTPTQRRIKEVLETLGFVVTYKKDGNGYVPPNGLPITIMSWWLVGKDPKWNSHF